MAFFNDLQKEVEAQNRQLKTITEKKSVEEPEQIADQPSTRKVTQSRDNSRDLSSNNSRVHKRTLPSRDEIQEFSFRLRDTLKVKVQAEVPHQWQDELEDMARKLDVKKLELYRFIIGEFLGKIQR